MPRAGAFSQRAAQNGLSIADAEPQGGFSRALASRAAASDSLVSLAASHSINFPSNVDDAASCERDAFLSHGTSSVRAEMMTDTTEPNAVLQWYTIVLPRVAVRSGPSLRHKVLATRSRGTLCASVERHGPWVRVLAFGLEPERRPLWLLTAGTECGLPDVILMPTQPPVRCSPEALAAAAALNLEDLLEPWSDDNIAHFIPNTMPSQQQLSRPALAAARDLAISSLFGGRTTTTPGAEGVRRLIAEFLRPRVLRFGPPAAVAGSQGRGAGLDQLKQPGGVCMLPGSAQHWTLYVCDSGNHRVMRFRPGVAEGEVVAGNSSCQPGAHPSELHWPIACSADPDGSLFIADMYNRRVVKWAVGVTEGQVITARDSNGTVLSLSRPSGVYAKQAGVLYVSDLNDASVHKYWLRHPVEGFEDGSVRGCVLSDSSVGLRAPRGIAVARTRCGIAAAAAAPGDIVRVRELVFVADGLRHEVLCLENGQIREKALVQERVRLSPRETGSNREERSGAVWKPPKTHWKSHDVAHDGDGNSEDMYVANDGGGMFDSGGIVDTSMSEACAASDVEEVDKLQRVDAELDEYNGVVDESHVSQEAVPVEEAAVGDGDQADDNSTLAPAIAIADSAVATSQPDDIAELESTARPLWRQVLEAVEQEKPRDVVPVRFEEELPHAEAAPQAGREIAGGSAGRGGYSNIQNLVRLPDGRIQDIATGMFWGFHERDGQDELSEPRGICYDAVDDAVYVADSGNGRVQRFSPPDSRFGETVAGGKLEMGRSLDTPVALCLGVDGSLFVVDSGSDRVLRYPAIAG